LFGNSGFKSVDYFKKTFVLHFKVILNRYCFIWRVNVFYGIGGVDMNIIVGVSVIALSLFSFSSVAKVGEIDSKVLVKKYYSGEPGYNRRMVKVYQKDSIDQINRQLASNPAGAGSMFFNEIRRTKSKFRQHRMNIRRHP